MLISLFEGEVYYTVLVVCYNHMHALVCMEFGHLYQ